jgi:HD-GYP domain-containing protein (c-di-GMP phosphodiesterase class II)
VAGAHHERLDGNGYPNRLSAADICLETRIITTADIFDAITADRPYRAAIPISETLKIMEKTVGTAVDPDCFEALKRAITRIDLTGEFKTLADENLKKISATAASEGLRFAL